MNKKIINSFRQEKQSKSSKPIMKMNLKKNKQKMKKLQEE